MSSTLIISIFVLFFLILIFYQNIKNFLHIHILMNIYSLISLITDKPIWLYYTNNDNLHKMKVISQKLNINLKNIKILDLGCGNGSMLDYFKKDSSELYGVDISPINIYNCKQKYKNSDNFQTANIIDYLNKNTTNNFDLIIINGVLGCFPLNEQKYIIEKSYNKLKKNGYMYLGAVQHIKDKNLFETYSIDDNFLKYLHKFNHTIYKEQELFNENKYRTENKLIIIQKK